MKEFSNIQSEKKKYTTITIRADFKENVLDPIKGDFGNLPWESIFECLIKNYYKECAIHIDEDTYERFKRYKGSYADNRFMQVLLDVYMDFLIR